MEPSGDPESRWISYLERDLLDIEPAQHPSEPPASFWNTCSAEKENTKLDSQSCDHKKRIREECPSRACANKREDCPGASCGKACREKMRRDRLNDRFMELSAVLEPDKPPKTDKASILRDAARVLAHLRAEVEQLRNANHQLHETIKEFKAEKNELRDEKTTLRLEKEQLEKQLKTVCALPGYMAHPPAAAMHAHAAAAAAAAYASSQNQTARFIKPAAYPDAPPFQMTMSQWMNPATIDTSNDHMLRPPVA